MNAPNNYPPPPPPPVPGAQYAAPPPAPAAPPPQAPQYQAPQYQAYAAPQVAPPGYGYAPPPAPAYAPQGFAPPPPQGFQAPVQNIQGLDLNGVNADGLSLLPQDAFTGRLRMMAYVDRPRPKAGPCYTVTWRVETSNQATMPIGAIFHQILKKSANPMKPGGEKTRKQILAAVHSVSANQQQDWVSLDAQLQSRNFDQVPTFVDLNQAPDYRRPMLDGTTRQPLPNQWWANQNFSVARTGA